MEKLFSDELAVISRKRFDELIKEEAILYALKDYGVDNWQGYDEAMDKLRKEEPEFFD